MRGVVSAGSLVALEELGYADVFDDIYACSSGAINAAYFMNRGTWLPLTIYFDDLTTGEFLDFRRVLRGRPPMNLEYVFGEVLASRKYLDYGQIIESSQKLHIVVTDVDTVSAVEISDFKSESDVAEALRASAWLPLATKGTTPFRGRRSIDGGVVRFHPFRAALLDGCTHVLSLSTRPIGPTRTDASLMTRFVAQRLDRAQPGLGAAHLAAVREYLREDKPFLAEARNDLVSVPSVLDLAPGAKVPEVKRHELDLGKLVRGAASGMELIHEALEQRSASAIIRFQVRDVSAGIGADTSDVGSP